MILDTIDNWKNYTGLNERITRGLEWLAHEDLDAMTDGKYEIDGRNLHVSVQHNSLKPIDKGRWEAHRKYIDIQYMVTGSEVMGYCPAKILQIAGQYNEEKDVLFFEEKLEAGSSFIVHAKMFAVFFPQDAHMPSLSIRTPADSPIEGAETVRKIVLKVAVL
jgi:YhcH/YjgK/YiaL family protein